MDEYLIDEDYVTELDGLTDEELKIRREIRRTMEIRSHDGGPFIKCILIVKKDCPECEKFNILLHDNDVPFMKFDIDSPEGVEIVTKFQLGRKAPMFMSPYGVVYYYKVPTLNQLTDWYESFYGGIL